MPVKQCPDRDRDGQLDEKILFDRFETFLRVEPMK